MTTSTDEGIEVNEVFKELHDTEKLSMIEEKLLKKIAGVKDPTVQNIFGTTMAIDLEFSQQNL